MRSPHFVNGNLHNRDTEILAEITSDFFLQSVAVLRYNEKKRFKASGENASAGALSAFSFLETTMEDENYDRDHQPAHPAR